MELEQRVDDLDNRVRKLESSEASILTTLTHFTASVNNFIKTLEQHEQKEDIRFEKFESKLEYITKVAYIGIGGLLLLQFLVSTKIISFGG